MDGLDARPYTDRSVGSRTGGQGYGSLRTPRTGAPRAHSEHPGGRLAGLRAQLGKGTIYYYFSSKEALLEELVANLSDEYFRGLLAGASGHETPLAIAQGIIEQLIEHYRQKPELFRVIYMVLGEPEPRPQKALQTFVESHLSWIESLKDETALVLQSHEAPEDAFLYLVSTFSHGVLFEAVSGRDPDRLLNETRAALDAFLASYSPAAR